MREAQAAKMRADGFVTVKEAASAAKSGLSTMYQWLDNKTVTGRTVGRARYVSVASLKAHLGPSWAEELDGLLK